MRTTDEGNWYCIYCGFDCTPNHKGADYAQEECPVRDGDFCQPKKHSKKSKTKGSR